MACLVSSARSRALVLSLALGLGATTVVASHPRTAALSQDEQEIEQVVTQAETSELTLPYPALGAVATDAAQVQGALGRATAILNSLYAPSSARLATRIGLVQRALEGEQGGNITVVQAGIRNVVFDSIAITGTVATVHLTFTGYSDFTVRQPDGQVARATPSNNMIGDVTLLKTGQGWRISAEVNRFAPGSEP